MHILYLNWFNWYWALQSLLRPTLLKTKFLHLIFLGTVEGRPFQHWISQQFDITNICTLNNVHVAFYFTITEFREKLYLFMYSGYFWMMSSNFLNTLYMCIQHFCTICWSSACKHLTHIYARNLRAENVEKWWMRLLFFHFSCRKRK